MSEVRTNIQISGDSLKYRSNISISVVTLDNNLIDSKSSFRTDLHISTKLSDGNTSEIKTNLELNNTNMTFDLVDMTKLNQTVLYFSKLINLDFEEDILWELLHRGTDEQINSSHIADALSPYIKEEKMTPIIKNIYENITTVNNTLHSHLNNSIIHLTGDEKSFLSNLMANPPETDISGDSFWEEDENGDLVPKLKVDGTLRGLKAPKLYLPNDDGTDVTYRFFIGELGDGSDIPESGGGGGSDVTFSSNNEQYGILSIDGEQVGVLSLNGHTHSQYLTAITKKNVIDALGSGTVEDKVHITGVLSMNTLILPDMDGQPTDFILNIGELGDGSDIPESGGGGVDVSSIEVYDSNGTLLGNGNDEGNIIIAAYPDLTPYATKDALTTGLSGKQNVISDLETIRSGATLGATAIQPEIFNEELGKKYDKTGGKISGDVDITGSLRMSTLILPNKSGTEGDYELYVGALGSGSDTPEEGGGIDIDALWAALATNDSNKVIDISHIPNLSWNKITSDKPTTLSGYGITDWVVLSDIDPHSQDGDPEFWISCDGLGVGLVTSNHPTAMWEWGNTGLLLDDDITLGHSVKIGGRIVTSEGYDMLYPDLANSTIYIGSGIYTTAIRSNGTFTHNGNTIVDSGNIGSYNAGSATKATKDGDGNIISSTYLKKNGDGEIIGTTNMPLSLRGDTSSLLVLKIGSSSKGTIGWSSIDGMRMYNQISYSTLGVDDDGIPYYSDSNRTTSTLIHSGNIGDYAPPISSSIPFASAINAYGYGYVSGGWATSGSALMVGVNSLYRMAIQGESNNTLLYRYCYNGTWGNVKYFAFTDDNVASATKLQTARTIWGQSFDGTENVSGVLTMPANHQIQWVDSNSMIYGDGSNLNISNSGGLYIRTVGYVGIGTTTPLTKLDVDGGNARITSYGVLFRDSDKPNGYNPTYMSEIYQWQDSIFFTRNNPTTGAFLKSVAYIGLKTGNFTATGNISASGYQLPTSAPSNPVSGGYYLYVGSLGAGATIS